MTPTMTATYSPLSFPSATQILYRVLIQASLLGLCIIALIALWTRAPRPAFAVFLAWTIAFYMVMFAFAWHLRPKCSLLAITRSRLFHQPPQQSIPRAPTPITQPSLGPYVHHQPPYHTAVSPDDASFSHRAPRSVVTDGYDDDIDEDTRQRMIEEEMGRREVSIITIPKRKLWIANPS